MDKLVSNRLFLHASSPTLVLVLVRKLVVICSGRMDPSFDLTIALDMEVDIFSFLQGEAITRDMLSSSTSSMSITMLPVLECWFGFSMVADKVKSG